MESITKEIGGIVYYENDGKVICNDYIIDIPTFSWNEDIKTVDCNYRPWKNNEMYGAFAQCFNLYDVRHINNNVTNMSSTFYNCQNLSFVNDLPNSLIDIGMAFLNCFSMIRSPVIPNTVVNMSWTYWNCINLKYAPEIPNSVVNMSTTFGLCHSLINAPEIPNSIVDMSAMFFGCNNLKNIGNIPNSVQKINQAFVGCDQIRGDIKIYSRNIQNAFGCFAETTNIKNVYIPFTYENGVFSATYNSFTSAGYSTTERVNGALLMDLYDNTSDIDLSDYSWYYDGDPDKQIVCLEKYIGTSNIVNQVSLLEGNQNG